MPALVTISCPEHGPFETRAREATRCPKCRRSLHVPARLRKPQAGPEPSMQVREVPKVGMTVTTVEHSRPRVNQPVIDNAITGTIVSDDEYERYVEPDEPSFDERIASVIDAWGYGVPGPVGIQEPQALRRVLITDERDTVVGSVALRIAERRARRKREQQYSCAYCGLRVREMYRVRSPAMSREQVLCYRHMLQEFSIPGASVERLG